MVDRSARPRSLSKLPPPSQAHSRWARVPTELTTAPPRRPAHDRHRTTRTIKDDNIASFNRQHHLLRAALLLEPPSSQVLWCLKHQVVVSLQLQVSTLTSASPRTVPLRLRLRLQAKRCIQTLESSSGHCVVATQPSRWSLAKPAKTADEFSIFH